MERRTRRPAPPRRRPEWTVRRGRTGAHRWLLLRRVLAAVLAALALALTARVALDRPLPDAVPTVVAAEDLPPGHLIGPGDIEVRHLLPDAVPATALKDPSEAVDSRLAAPVPAGVTLTPQVLRTSSALGSLPEDTVAVFLAVPDPVVATTLSPPDRVDVHSPVDGSVVVSDALVLRSETGDRPGLWLALSRRDAEALAGVRAADAAGGATVISLRPSVDS